MQFFDWKTRTVKDTAIEFMGVGMFSYAISVCTEVPCLGGGGGGGGGTNFPYSNKFCKKHPVSL